MSSIPTPAGIFNHTRGHGDSARLYTVAFWLRKDGVTLANVACFRSSGSLEWDGVAAVHCPVLGFHAGSTDDIIKAALRGCRWAD